MARMINWMVTVYLVLFAGKRYADVTEANNLDLNNLDASHVILLDLWWIPTTEDQAIDRISQTHPVTVSQLVVIDPQLKTEYLNSRMKRGKWLVWISVKIKAKL